VDGGAPSAPGGRYFGSYARGDWGVGSDLDLVAVVLDRADVASFERRAQEWDVTGLPVSADLLVYTESEWGEIVKRDDRFARTMRDETVWLLDRTDRPEAGPRTPTI
jgi:predicted nucleotidyltransferase